MRLARFYGAARAALRPPAPILPGPVIDEALRRFVATLERLETEARRKDVAGTPASPATPAAPRRPGAGRIRALDLAPLHGRDP